MIQYRYEGRKGNGKRRNHADIMWRVGLFPMVVEAIKSSIMVKTEAREQNFNGQKVRVTYYEHSLRSNFNASNKKPPEGGL